MTATSDPDRHLRIRKLRDYSIITYAFERVFWVLHALSPSRLAGGSRVAHVRSEAFQRDPQGATARRSRRVDAYVLTWFGIEAALLTFVATGDLLPRWLVQGLVGIRILDILQTAVNLSVFDQLRTGERIRISSAVRTLVLSFLNYLELIVCFAIVYVTLGDRLVGYADWTDAVYFSVVTQLTIGFGDIHPIGSARAATMIQALVGVVFTVLIFGRIVTVLPRIDSVIKNEPDE